LMECFIAFPFGGNEWLRQLAIKQRSEWCLNGMGLTMQS
jgi:hypothetical protein